MVRASELADVRVGTHRGYTRVVLETDAPASYRLGEPEEGTPPEIVLELDARSDGRAIASRGLLVTQIRVEPAGRGTTVRIALATVNVHVTETILSKPPRIVLDFRRLESRAPESPPRQEPNAKAPPAPSPPPTKAKATPAAAEERKLALEPAKPPPGPRAKPVPEPPPPPPAPPPKPRAAERPATEDLEALAPQIDEMPSAASPQRPPGREARTIVAREEFDKLSPDEQRKLPFFDLLPTLDLDETSTTALVELVFLDLRYYLRKPSGAPSPELRASVEQFQKDLGHEPTGTLLLGEFQELMRRMAAVHPVPVYPGNFSLVEEEGGVVLVQGTWQPQGSAPPDPIQTSEIRCERKESACVEATAVLFYGSGKALLDIGVAQWKVVRWSNERIVAKREAAPCFLDTLEVRFEGKKVSKSRRSKEGGECADRAPETARLGDGSRVGYEYFRRRWEEAHSGYSSAFGDAFRLPLAPAP